MAQNVTFFPTSKITFKTWQWKTQHKLVLLVASLNASMSLLLTLAHQILKHFATAYTTNENWLLTQPQRVKTNLCAHKENSYVNDHTQKQFFKFKNFMTVNTPNKIPKFVRQLTKRQHKTIFQWHSEQKKNSVIVKNTLTYTITLKNTFKKFCYR